MLHERGFAARFKEPFVFRGGGKFVIITLEQQAASVGADEEGEAGDPLGTFSTVWDGSLALAEVLSKGGSGIRIEGAQVVELGSGCGLGGLVAAACGARSVALTDLPEALPLLRRNLRANSFVLWGCNVSVKPYTWGSPDLPVDSVDLILAADLVYRDEHAALLVSTIGVITQANPKARAVFSQCTAHNPMAWSALTRGFADGGFSVQRRSLGGGVELAVVERGRKKKTE
eukprot:Hpha_TRINITY_DN7477_c0_g1::TRINITY_DN7477_c0_g1_i2::g.95889::m.95889